VLVETDTLLWPTLNLNAVVAAIGTGNVLIAPALGLVGMVALVVLTHPTTEDVVVPALGLVTTVPHTSQSPAVSVIDVMSVGFPVDKETPLPIKTVDSNISPTNPALALSLVVVPTMPLVVGLKVIELVVKAGNVVLKLGTPELLVTNTLLLAVASPVTVFAPLEYRMLLAV
jgi:hypothetical protein